MKCAGAVLRSGVKGASVIYYYCTAMHAARVHTTSLTAMIHIAPFCIYSLTDFDEKCSKEDDWDVDMGVYYDPGEQVTSLTVTGSGLQSDMHVC